MSDAKHTMTHIPGDFAISRLDPHDHVPAWALAGSLFSVTRTFDELSIVCEAGLVPEGVRSDGGWRCLKVEGPFAFSIVGVVSALASALARSGVSVVVVATYDTDYLFVRAADLDRAVDALRADGHTVRAG
jgi:hypothetical protein